MVDDDTRLGCLWNDLDLPTGWNQSVRSISFPIATLFIIIPTQTGLRSISRLRNLRLGTKPLCNWIKTTIKQNKWLNGCHPVVWHNKAYTDIYVNTQQLLLNTTLFCAWRHVSAPHTAIFRPAYNRTGPFMCAQYRIPHCLHIKYMWNKYICKTYDYMWLKR